MQPAQNLRALFLRRAPETGERVLGCHDSVPRILFIGQRDAADHFAVGRVDDVHDLAAVGFNKRAIDLVSRDSVHACFSLCEDLVHKNFLSGVQAASLLGSAGAFRCVASFFWALKTRHWTVPIGLAVAAAISWYSHSSTKRKISASRSRDSKNVIQ
jgi:hypothetical protein